MSSNREQAAAPRIDQAAYVGVTIALFSVALVTYAIRTYIRICVMKRFLADDYLLLFAVVVLIATTGVVLGAAKLWYDILTVFLNGATTDVILNVLDEAPLASRLGNTSGTLWWFVLIPVKLAFTVFFRRIVNHVRSLRLLCNFVIGFTVLAGLICMAVGWLSCPYLTLAGMISCAAPDAAYRQFRIISITAAFDIASDVLLVSLPIVILRRTHIEARQKLMIAVPLCLSLVMVVVTIIRMSGVRLNSGATDIIWSAFWIHQECSIAVIMISVSAFRSFFVQNSSKPSSPQWLRNYKSSRRRTPEWKPGKWGSSEESNSISLPRIPDATLTGMRTFIDAAGMTTIDLESASHEQKSEESEEPLLEP